ncbi:cysteine dioxygenase [Siminovitchia sediminis]|uniref:Cysteine dioxygenase n=1 Tax=Siminovitchia sediminis TaxID=1274353 RepID=A0ABW4KPZ0_9BACI
MNYKTEAYQLEDFIREMTDIVEKTDSEADRVSKAEHLVGKLIRSISWLTEDKRKPSNEGYARYSLYVDPQDRFEVLVLVWQPGHKTSLHDHDGTWGVEGIVSGQVRVTNYIQEGNVSKNVVRLRHTGSIVVQEQDTGTLLPPADCHTLEVEGDQPAITIHVYGKQLCHFKVFEPTGEKELYNAKVSYVKYSG